MRTKRQDIADISPKLWPDEHRSEVLRHSIKVISFARGYITSREATDACLDAGLDITDVERVTGFLIDRGVIFNDDAKLSLPNMRNASSDNDEDEYNESDDDEVYDRAQADYGALYAAIKKEYPQMSHLLDASHPPKVATQALK